MLMVPATGFASREALLPDATAATTSATAATLTTMLVTTGHLRAELALF
jgi:hypothetical protein